MSVEADVLDALRVAVVHCLAPERVPERDPLAAPGHERDQAPLEVQPLGRARVVAAHAAGERLLDGGARARIAKGARGQRVGVEPALLQPGRSDPAGEPRRRLAQELLERHFLERRVPLAVGGPPGRAGSEAGDASGHTKPRNRSSRRGATLRRLDEVGVVHVVLVPGRDGIRVDDVLGLRRGQRRRQTHRRRAALARVGERAARRIEREHDERAERFDPRQLRRALRRREWPDVRMNRVPGQEPQRGPRLRGRHGDLLRIEGRVIRNLVPRLRPRREDGEEHQHRGEHASHDYARAGPEAPARGATLPGRHPQQNARL